MGCGASSEAAGPAQEANTRRTPQGTPLNESGKWVGVTAQQWSEAEEPLAKAGISGADVLEPGKWVGVTAKQWLEAEEPLAKAGISGADVLAFQKGLQCKFWFVRADKLRAFEGRTPQKLQVLLRDHPDWLELRTVTFSDGIAGMYAQSYLVVSHRWEQPGAPDEMGVQFALTKAYLLANEAIEWVWFDYWSMPQGDKEPWELVAFKVMLHNINLLYLFCGVLVLIDLSYVSRFWTQFEAFLSLRTVAKNGLEPATEAERRCVIKCIHNAPSSFEGMIIDMWADKTANEAHDILAKPDVTVTNQSDKDLQLPKLLELNAFAAEAAAAAELAAREDPSLALQGSAPKMGLWLREVERQRCASSKATRRELLSEQALQQVLGGDPREEHVRVSLSARVLRRGEVERQRCASSKATRREQALQQVLGGDGYDGVGDGDDGVGDGDDGVGDGIGDGDGSRGERGPFYCVLHGLDAGGFIGWGRLGASRAAPRSDGRSPRWDAIDVPAYKFDGARKLRIDVYSGHGGGHGGGGGGGGGSGAVMDLAEFSSLVRKLRRSGAASGLGHSPRDGSMAGGWSDAEVRAAFQRAAVARRSGAGAGSGQLLEYSKLGGVLRQLGADVEEREAADMLRHYDGVIVGADSGRSGVGVGWSGGIGGGDGIGSIGGGGSGGGGTILEQFLAHQKAGGSGNSGVGGSSGGGVGGGEEDEHLGTVEIALPSSVAELLSRGKEHLIKTISLGPPPTSTASTARPGASRVSVAAALGTVEGSIVRVGGELSAKERDRELEALRRELDAARAALGQSRRVPDDVRAALALQ